MEKEKRMQLASTPGRWWMVPLLSVASLAAAGSDLRLVEAARNGDKEAVRSLLEQHVDVNAPQADGATALAWAAHRDDLEMAELLIRSGAKVTAANDYGATPLWLAGTNGNAAMVEKLLKAGADPKAALLSGETTLMAAADRGSTDVVKLLLAHGADVNAREAHGGQTALMWAVAERHADVSRLLIEHGADVHARSKGGFTPLLFAARQGDLDSAQILLAAGANVNEATPDGMSVLMMASGSGQEAFSRFLLDKGADPNAMVADSGLTALHYAAAGRNMLESVKALLAHGANPNARIAKDVRGFDLRDPIGATPFLLAATSGNASVMRVLAAAGADPRRGLKDQTTPLMIAAGNSRGRSNYREYTPAEEKGAVEAVQVVVELSPDIINAANDEGQTALHAAAYIGADSVIQLLLNNGAKMDVLDKFGQTPLSIAANVVTVGLGGNFDMKPRRFRETTVNLLLKSGATPLSAAGLQLVEPLPRNLR